MANNPCPVVLPIVLGYIILWVPSAVGPTKESHCTDHTAQYSPVPWLWSLLQKMYYNLIQFVLWVMAKLGPPRLPLKHLDSQMEWQQDHCIQNCRDSWWSWGLDKDLAPCTALIVSLMLWLIESSIRKRKERMFTAKKLAIHASADKKCNAVAKEISQTANPTEQLLNGDYDQRFLTGDNKKRGQLSWQKLANPREIRTSLWDN